MREGALPVEVAIVVRLETRFEQERGDEEA